MIVGYDVDTVKLLWHRIDSGSWVTPQIGAALSVVDPNFLEDARTRLEAGCQVDTSALMSMTALQRHSATGPAGSVARSAKAAQALLKLVQMQPLKSPWLEKVIADSEFQRLLAQDMDKSDILTENFLQRIKAISVMPV